MLQTIKVPQYVPFWALDCQHRIIILCHLCTLDIIHVMNTCVPVSFCSYYKLLPGNRRKQEREFFDTNFETGKPCQRFNWMLQCSLGLWWRLAFSQQGFPISKLVSEKSLFHLCRSQLRSNHFEQAEILRYTYMTHIKSNTHLHKYTHMYTHEHRNMPPGWRGVSLTSSANLPPLSSRWG